MDGTTGRFPRRVEHIRVRDAARYTIEIDMPFRRLPSDSPPRVDRGRSRFGRLVSRAMRNLPPSVAARIDNLAVVVADGPSPRQRASLGVDASEELLGLYEGIPRPQRADGYSFAMPDKITLFRRAIESRATNEQELYREIRATLIHEIAHHFGIDDDRLRELGRD
jgi:predicted Zn-dependent protease with MMP-like domain